MRGVCTFGRSGYKMQLAATLSSPLHILVKVMGDVSVPEHPREASMSDDRKPPTDGSHGTTPVTPSAAPTSLLSSNWRRLRRRWPVVAAASKITVDVRTYVRRAWQSETVLQWRNLPSEWREKPYSGVVTLVVGSVLITLLVWLSRQFFLIPNVGVIYLPLIAMLAYYWRWRLAIVGCVVQLVCVYFLILPPGVGLKMLDAHSAAQLFLLAAISVYVLLLVMFARSRGSAAEHEVARFAALNTVGTALSGELHESQLLQLIARTACDLTGAGFAAFTLRPVDAMDKPVGPSEGSLFHLAAVVGVSPEQENLFRRVPLGGEGILAPIFRHGVTVRVGDALALLPEGHHAALAHRDQTKASSGASSAAQESDDGQTRRETRGETPRDVARRQADAFAHGLASAKDLRAVGYPRGHPITRSFLGAPLLDRDGNVRGGLLLGHAEPERFTKDDETLLKALAAQASVALENARLYHDAQSQAEELNALFESITDGVMVYDHQGRLIHQNHAATNIATFISSTDGAHAGNPSISDLLARLAPDGSNAGAHAPFSFTDAHGDAREYVVNVSPLHAMTADDELVSHTAERVPVPDDERTAGGTVVVWHEVTATRKLLAEQQARAEAEARRTLLQKVIDELPSGVYLVRGRDAAMVLANVAAQDVWGAHWAAGQSMADFLETSGTQIVGSGGRLLETGELATVRALRTGEAIHHYQEVVRRPDSTSLPVLLNAVTLDPRMLEDTSMSAPDTEAQPLPDRLALVVLQDVTAMKEAERLKDEFVAIAAHELKTPMTAVKGYADMLVRHSQNDAATHLESWQVEALETIDQATNRLVELTEDLLDVARLQAERIELHSEPHDLIALARRVIKRFQMASVQHTLSLVAADEFVVAALDVRRTEQIIGNLLSNAIKYSPDGGPITITIEQDERERVARLSVRDSGIGIPASQQSLLFNRFVRADNARERGIAGTGLGLYLCRELVELQEGHLWFTSEEGRGSTFFLTLPLAEEAV
jgi:signal transduction histidine kinase/GAF domain-containing protein